VRQGVGVQENTWEMPMPDVAGAADQAVQTIVAWMREAVATMRRPYGLDHVAVAFACRNADGRVLCSNTLGVVRPSVFYTDEGEERVRQFLVDAWHARPGEGAQIVGALLSLGEVAHELGIANAA
jgi:hypothetical protein